MIGDLHEIKGLIFKEVEDLDGTCEGCDLIDMIYNVPCEARKAPCNTRTVLKLHIRW